MRAVFPFLVLLASVVLAFAQNDSVDYSPAHLCSRCHLNDMLEWSISGHANAGTACTDCHGPSEGHLIDERNNVKPDRVPHGEAIASLCRNCHTDGCPSTKRTDNCQSCHHVHALVDVNKQAAAEATDETAEERRNGYVDALAAGDALRERGRYGEALARYEQALSIRPGDERAGNGAAFCRRRVDPAMPGFRITGDGFDEASGLPLRVEVPAAGIRMALVPGGAADIGDAKLPASQLVHTVVVEPFYLGQYEITQEQWQRVMGENPSHYTGDDAGEMPVESVSWSDARRFVAGLNKLAPAGGFRLPTEAEWEFAARAAGGSDLGARAWYRDNSSVAKPGRRDEPAEFARPRRVGLKQPNALGLYDMEGNVWEWCSSLLRPYPYVPTDGREDRDGQGLRVLRGGSFVDRADLLAPAFRHGERADRRIRWNGLRVARTPPDVRSQR